MVGTPLWWGVQFIVSFLDFVMMYIFVHKVIGHNIKITPKCVLICAVYTLTLAPVFYFWGGYVFRLVTIVWWLVAVKLIDNYNKSAC